ncbi:MAG: efflux RND transporter periplasmic adaptor subunit [Spirochaetes bacterium]|jgi:HlyD family secretion protein|nr:efflux RND transporter periplasmic adaptor subunit [Spirochaetota bacterium]
MRKRARIIFIVVVVVAAIGVIAAVALGRRGPGTLEMVEAHEVRYDSMTETISGTGSFVPGAKGTAYAKVSGTVEEILVEEGQSVDAGDLLLRIEDDDYAQALEKAQVSYQTARRAALQQVVSLQNTVKTAERNLAKTERSHSNNIELREANAISQEQFQQSQEALEEAQDALASARARLNLYMGRSISAEPILSSQEAEEVVDQIPDVRQAALNVEDARDSLQNTRPRAPSSGTVATISVEEGGIVTPNAPLVRIEQLNQMTAEVQIDEVDIGKISTGDTAEISSDSILGETLTGTVRNISPVIQRVGNTRVSNVEISLDTDGRRLKSGASCTARISTTTKERALVIPITAYQSANEETFTYVMEPVGASESGGGDGSTQRYRLDRRRITLGLVTINQVEVTGGLSEGELVAAGNFSRLREDMLVGREQSQS